MKKKIYLILIVLVIIVACLLQWFTCCNCNVNKVVNNCDSSETKKNITTKKTAVKNSYKTKKVSKNVVKYPFVIKDNATNLDLTCNDNYNFKQDSYKYEEPLSEDLTKSIESLKDYSFKNPKSAINVVGYYKADEKNTSIFPNLGLARANTIKDHLVSEGIPLKLIHTSGELKNEMSADSNNIFYGPVKFGISEIKTKDNLEYLLADIQKNPLVFNFKTGKASITITQEQKVQLDKISTYLNNVNGAKCIVVGHTDSKGNTKSNFYLGQKRADNAKFYLAKNGIAKQRIEAISKGELKPIANNASEKGRKINRRAIITIKN